MNDYPAVLYVEDDPQNRMVMEILLRESMQLAHVAIWEDSSHFEERMNALELRLDIILLDIHVEPIDGFEMLRLLRQMPQYADTPILAVTASVMNEEVESLKRAGFDGAISKPIPIDAFPQIVYAALEGNKIWRVM